MKILVNVARVIVGVLFIFSGLIKANDPLGLSYKMQEFFDVWGRDESLTTFMNWMSTYALEFSIIIITLEIIVGVGILLGMWKKFFATLLLILTIFFTFLTGYAVLSGKIATCGCFGDCIPLTSMTSFIKDIVLTVLILIIFFGQKHIYPVLTAAFNTIILVFSIALVLLFQWYVLRHMPMLDCLPFKKGNNLIELRKMPADAVQDKKEYKFVYEKDGKKQNFTVKDLPDSTWEFVSREDVIIEKGKNNEPPIKDFYLNTLAGNDSTEAILNLDADYYMFFIKDAAKEQDVWLSDFKKIYEMANAKKLPLYIISPQTSSANVFFNEQNNYKLPVLSLDATSFKTAARTSPELYLMNGPVVKNKWGKVDLEKALK